MKNTIVIIILFSLMGCSIVGSQLGAAADKKSGKNKYKNKYAKEGLEIDIEILVGLFSTTKNLEQIDDRACKEPETHQVCTVSKGCWCEKG